jgi:hypothetical protein
MPRLRRARRPSPEAPKTEAAGRLLVDPEVARPLPSLVFLSPLLAFYAFGLIWVRPDLVARADLLVREAIRPLGLTGILAPTWLVVGILMAWHMIRRDPTRVRLDLVGRMAVETAILSVPLFAILAVSTVILHGATALALPAARAAPAATTGLAVAMTSIGAGIYEELLFRLVMVGGTLWLARKVMGRRSSGVMVAAVLVSAAVFAGAHTLDDPARFGWDSFLYRTAAGTYLGYVFARRGFGIVVGVHMVYDLVLKLAIVLR